MPGPNEKYYSQSCHQNNLFLAEAQQITLHSGWPDLQGPEVQQLAHLQGIFTIFFSLD